MKSLPTEVEKPKMKHNRRKCQGTSFRIISPVDSCTEDSGWMDKSETVKNGHKSNIAVSVHSTPGDAVKLVHEGKFSAPRKDSKPPTEAGERADWKVRTNYDNGSCRQGATSQPEVKVANKGTSKLLIAECIQKWSNNRCRQLTIVGETSVQKSSL